MWSLFFLLIGFQLHSKHHLGVGWLLENKNGIRCFERVIEKPSLLTQDDLDSAFSKEN